MSSPFPLQISPFLTSFTLHPNNQQPTKKQKENKEEEKKTFFNHRSSMAELDIPSYFLCPISFQIMADPVTLPTGITYDRSSIERWLLTINNNNNNNMMMTCPVTNQSLPADQELTPNHTLRRLIQSWCVANAVDRVPTPRPPVNKSHIAKLIQDPHTSQLTTLKNLSSIIQESERNRMCVASSEPAVDYLVSVIRYDHNNDEAVNKSLAILDSLRLSDNELISLVSRNEMLIGSLSRVLITSPYAITLLKSIIFVISPNRLTAVTDNMFVNIVSLLGDSKTSVQNKKTTIKALMGLCPWGRNRIKAAQAGAVKVLIEILLDSDQERRVCEMVLVVLEKLSGCAEGRAEIVSHAAGIAVIAKKVLRVSASGSERAVKILHSIARYSATAAVLEEMVQAGVVKKLCTVLVLDCGVKAKERAREMLRMHARVWRKSPCLSPHFRALYPSS